MVITDFSVCAYNLFILFCSTLAPFDSGQAKQWRNANFALTKVVNLAQKALEVFSASDEVCTISISTLGGATAAPCIAARAVVKTGLELVFFLVLEVCYNVIIQITFSFFVC